ncbi:unnamed protein product [Durusdinium trenchii]|uniref:Uncharacterized protein n=1 Tax=Durusdinium trenchii TaxID=1381693 RepID=A0ABP0S413_9DINO
MLPESRPAHARCATKLKRFLLRYFPPGIILEYHGINGDLETKSIELGSLDPETDVDALVKKLVREEGLISESNKEALQKMIFKLMDKIKDQESQRFELVQILRGHLLPLTSCSFNKSCSKILTASFDRSCRVWDVFGEELLTLEGHDGPVNAAAFNNPLGDRIVTGSGKLARLWDANSGQCLHVLKGHEGRITCASFNLQSSVLCTGSSDGGLKLWDVEIGLAILSLRGHSGDISSVSFSTDGEKILSGSFDNTAKIWDVRTGKCLHTLSGHGSEIKSKQLQDGHRGYISAASFDFAGHLCLTGSFDGTCKLWRVKNGRCMDTLRGHNMEKKGQVDRPSGIHPVLHACFNPVGDRFATCSTDCNILVYRVADEEGGQVMTALVCKLNGAGPVSKVQFSPNGRKLISISDRSCRLWSIKEGTCLQVLEGHGDEILDCTFDYEGDTIITGSKDNTCRIWRDRSLMAED